MNIRIQNCNNILDGIVNIVEGSLNIKYAVNGTGKSTIAKAIVAASKQDIDALKLLKPYCYMEGAEHESVVTGLDESVRKVLVFDESYINQYVYQQGELLKNSFEIFVKTSDYDKHMNQIQQLVIEIGETFRNNPELDELIVAFMQFLDGCGKSQTGLAASGAIVKAFGKGNKINNIPTGLEAFKPYLSNSQDASNVKWLKWQADGRKYLEMAEQCPYCSGSIAQTKEKIIRISEEYDSKTIEHLNKMLVLFAQLYPYFSQSTRCQLDAITNNAGNLNVQQKNYLFEIKKQVQTMYSQLVNLKNLGYQTFKDGGRIADKLQSYLINLELFSHLHSDVMKEKVNAINDSLKNVLIKAGKLQGEVNQQNKLIQKTIQDNSKAINEFLQCAGYDYMVAIEESEQNGYKMILHPSGYDVEISAVRDHLSFGERNALALVLFMFSALKENPDLIILDDPISSFDGNKKFALLNMLFMSNTCLRNRTVLLLTHDFNSVIDVIHTMPQNFSPAPHGYFLCNKNGILEEKAIIKANIQSFHQIAMANMSAPIDSLNKLVYLRRLLEIEDCKDNKWQLLSNLFHKREIPEIHDNGERKMSEKEILDATSEIQKCIPDFDYNKEYVKTQDRKKLIHLYNQSTCNYEKLQLYRILYNENHENPVVKKFVNETFHAENDFLFQLNPREYETIPQFIINECDKDIALEVQNEKLQ